MKLTMRVVLLLDFDGVIVDSPAHFRDATCDVANRILFFLPGRCDLLDNLYERYVKRKGTRGNRAFWEELLDSSSIRF